MLAAKDSIAHPWEIGTQDKGKKRDFALSYANIFERKCTLQLTDLELGRIFVRKQG